MQAQHLELAHPRTGDCEASAAGTPKRRDARVFATLFVAPSGPLSTRGRNGTRNGTPNAPIEDAFRGTAFERRSRLCQRFVLGSAGRRRHVPASTVQGSVVYNLVDRSYYILYIYIIYILLGRG
ncbi:unnamed protein product, partial [Ixodes persulcatus]